MFYMMVCLYYNNLSEKFLNIMDFLKLQLNQTEFLHVDPLWPIVKCANHCHACQCTPLLPLARVSHTDFYSLLTPFCSVRTEQRSGP